MATGRNLQLTKQVGEYLVAAELCRLDLIATTFTGNVPDYDIVAISENGKSILIQVKAIRGGSWQFSDARAYLHIEQKGKRQVPGQRTDPKYPDLICVFVLLGSSYGGDRFFVLRWVELQELISTHYRENLRGRGGIRPRRHDSYHVGLSASHLEKYEGWKTIRDAICRSAD